MAAYPLHHINITNFKWLVWKLQELLRWTCPCSTSRLDAEKFKAGNDGETIIKVPSWQCISIFVWVTISIIYIYIYIYLYTYIYIYIWTYTCIYTHSYTFIHTNDILCPFLIYIAYIERSGDKVQQHDGPAVMDGISWLTVRLQSLGSVKHCRL